MTEMQRRSATRTKRAIAFPMGLALALSGAGCDSGETTGNGGGGATDTSTDTTTGGSTSTEGPLPSCDMEVHDGKATYYNEADGGGACSFDPIPGDLLVGAMNVVDYQSAAACGTCAAIDGPDGSVTVRIVDLCPGCGEGHIDLSPEAFSQIAALELGVVETTWRYVACDGAGPIQYKFKEGSNPYWTAVQVRHHRYEIATFEVEKDGAWVSVPRTDYNYFVDDQGMGEGPYKFRVTDIYGHSVEDADIAFAEGGVVEGKAQLPACDSGM